ncbi:MAG: ACP phosphodiesterase [Sulfurovum sp.]
MNWLAHIFLSEQKIDFQLGNFLADPLKGRLWQGASEEFERGMESHKRIDAYTDSHKIVSLSKSRLRKKGLLKPVIIDLTYDYLLSKNWNLFSNISKDEFLKQFNANAKTRAYSLPPRPLELVLNLVEADRLNRYNSLEQLKISFERIDTRLSSRLLAKENAVGYFDKVEEIIDDIEEDFLIFFPQLCQHTKQELHNEYISHWRG